VGASAYGVVDTLSLALRNLCAFSAHGVHIWEPALIKRLIALWTIVRGDAKRLWIALRHPMSPAWLKGGVALIVLYLVSPIDLIPDALPIIGVMDDLIVVPMAIRALLKRLPPAVQAEIQRRMPG
jgi:uncharacterized membrane protein YkvA (DUF1232 family)